eukprot:jgi/Astpho2/4857/gw1.00069.123.1_t
MPARARQCANCPMRRSPTSMHPSFCKTRRR